LMVTVVLVSPGFVGLGGTEGVDLVVAGDGDGGDGDGGDGDGGDGDGAGGGPTLLTGHESSFVQ